MLLDDIAERDFEDAAQLLKALPADATRLLTTRSKDIDSLGAIVYPLPDLAEQDALAIQVSSTRVNCISIQRRSTVAGAAAAPPSDAKANLERGIAV